MVVVRRLFSLLSFAIIMQKVLAVAAPSTGKTTAAFAANTKMVTFIRHGTTYMNEYLGGADGGKSFGSPHFTDVFEDNERRQRYHDSPLSPRGLLQAKKLANSNRRPDFVDACELVVVSPLTRALQTFEIGLKPHFASNDDDDDDGLPQIIAVPEAAERLYLISDVGRPVSELQKSYRYVDFETGFTAGKHDRNKWWYQPRDDRQYSEWRPVGKGQRYAYYGEPDSDFDLRMSRFHAWLDQRPENNIAVVCHHGVIDWMLDMDFDNCQYRQVAFHSIRPKSLLL